jgi:phenylalanyl-tRNA synthetase beta chain
VSSEGRAIGFLGTVDPRALESAGLKSGFAHAAELELGPLGETRREPVFAPLSKYPPVVRDFTFLAGEQVRWDDILCTLRGLDLNELAGIHLVDRYSGQEIPEGFRSWTFTLVFQSQERTLTEEDTAPVAQRVAGAMQEALGATLR